MALGREAGPAWDDSTDTAGNPALWHLGDAIVGEFFFGAFGPAGGNRTA